MSIPGLNPSLPSPLGSPLRPDPRRTPGGMERPGTPAPGSERAGTPAAGAGRAAPAPANAAALRPQAPIAGGAAAQGAVPAEAPKGTDPALWSVLTTEERQFFAKTAAMGPLTYGRLKEATAPVPPSARGVRLDVRA
jgi:hypothetical protein